MEFLDFDCFINEMYYSQNYNLMKVANSKEPVVGKPVFIDNDTKSIYAVRRKIFNDLEAYEKFVNQRTLDMEKAKEKAKGARDEKSKIKIYDYSIETRALALKVVNDSANFMKEFNEVYDSLKEDLLGSDHVKVANAILKLREMYPYGLIQEAGKLKRRKKLKLDVVFISDVIKWSDSIKTIYDTLDEAGKILGKTDKQIEGYRKLSYSQSVRWGMY